MPFELDLEEGKFLVQLARNTVKTYLEKHEVIGVPKETSKKLFEKCGVFVTISLLKSGEKRLRGCIGYPIRQARLLKP